MTAHGNTREEARCPGESPQADDAGDTPFFRKLRTVGMVVAAVGTSIIAAPVALPAALVTVGGYLIVGGSVISAVSQAAVGEKDCEM